MHKVKFKAENNNNKSNTQKQNKNGGGDQDKLNEMISAQTQKHKKVLLLWFKNKYSK